MAAPNSATDLKTLQRRVDESVGTIKRLFDAASDCMAIIGSEDGRFLAANPAFEEMTGHSFDELQWMHLWEIWRPDMADDARVTFRKIAESGSGSGTEVPLLTKDGKIITAEFAARTIRHQGKDALLSIIVDITDRKVSERREAELVDTRATAEEALKGASTLGEWGADLCDRVEALRQSLSGDAEHARQAEEILALAGEMMDAARQMESRLRSALEPEAEQREETSP